MSEKFWLKSNNGSKFDITQLKEIKKSDLNNNPVLQKIFNIFDTQKSDGTQGADGVLSGTELTSLFNTMLKASNSKSNNSIFNTDEAEEYINTTKTKEGKTLNELGVKANDLFNFLKVVLLKDNTQQVSTDLIADATEEESFTPEEIRNLSVETVSNNFSTAYQIFHSQNDNQGKISDVVNDWKELWDTDFAASRVNRYIRTEGVCEYLLNKSNSEEGLTQKEYLERKLDLAVSLLPAIKDTALKSTIAKNLVTLGYYEKFDNKTEAEKERIIQEMEIELLKRALSQLTPEELDTFILRIANASDEEYASLAQQTTEDLINQSLQEIEAENQYSLTDSRNYKLDQEPRPESIENILQNSASYRKMTFEETFKAERGVEYNPEKVMDYEQKNAQMQFVLGTYNRISLLKDNLEHALAGLATTDAQGMNADIMAPQEVQNLNATIVDILSFLNSGDKETIENILSQICNRKVEIRETQSESGTLFTLSLSSSECKEVAAYIKELLDGKLEQALNGKTLEEYQDEASKAYKEAFGDKNSINIAEEYQKSQQEGVQTVKTVAGTGAMVMMVAGYFVTVPAVVAGSVTVPVAAAGLTYGGLALSVFGGAGISYIENSTKAGGMTEEDKVEMLKELGTSLALVSSGMGIGKVSESAFRMLVLKNCPKLLAWASEVGIDATMSLVADYAITGQIDLSGEGIAQLQNILVGLLHAKGNFKTYLNTHVGEIPTRNTDVTAKQKSAVGLVGDATEIDLPPATTYAEAVVALKDSNSARVITDKDGNKVIFYHKNALNLGDYTYVLFDKNDRMINKGTMAESDITNAFGKSIENAPKLNTSGQLMMSLDFGIVENLARVLKINIADAKFNVAQDINNRPDLDKYTKSSRPATMEHSDFVSSRRDLFGENMVDYGFWSGYIPKDQHHGAWKMHLFSVDEADWQVMCDVIIPYLKEHGIDWKTFNILHTPEMLDGAQSGKAFTIYPKNNEDMAQIAKDLDYIIRRNNLEKTNSHITGDNQMGSTGRLFYRYEFNSGKYKDEILDLADQSDSRKYHNRYDANRGEGRYLADDMSIEDDIWRNFDPSAPNSMPERTVQDQNMLRKMNKGETYRVDINTRIELPNGEVLDFSSERIRSCMRAMKPGDAIVIGRDPQIGGNVIGRIKINDPQNLVSRQHLKITRTRDGFIVEDLGSTNGSKIYSQQSQDFANNAQQHIVANTPTNVPQDMNVDEIFVANNNTRIVLPNGEVLDFSSERIQSCVRAMKPGNAIVIGREPQIGGNVIVGIEIHDPTSTVSRQHLKITKMSDGSIVVERIGKNTTKIYQNQQITPNQNIHQQYAACENATITPQKMDKGKVFRADIDTRIELAGGVFTLDFSNPNIRAALNSLNENESLLVGRTVTGLKDIQIDSKYVSGQHLKITRTRDGFIVEDLGSTNGSKIYQTQSERAIQYGNVSARQVNINPVTQSRNFNQTHKIGCDERISDGYKDGGRSARINNDGSVESSREIIVVDRNKDFALQQMIQEVKRKTANMNDKQKAAFIQDYVAKKCGDGHFANENLNRWLPSFRNKEVLLGDIISANPPIAVCRHRSLLSKILGDEVGLHIELQRGNFYSNGSGGGHAWNVVKFDDGTSAIYDAMHNKTSNTTPGNVDPYAQQYYTTNNEFLYNNGVSAYNPY